MSDLFVIDTHALLWHLDGSPRLGEQAKQILDNPDARLLLPAIALAEALFVLERKGALFSLSEEQLVNKIKEDSRIAIAETNLEVIETSLECKAVREIHDRLIVATAVLAQKLDLSVSIISRDNNIRETNLVPVIW